MPASVSLLATLLERLQLPLLMYICHIRPLSCKSSPHEKILHLGSATQFNRIVPYRHCGRGLLLLCPHIHIYHNKRYNYTKNNLYFRFPKMGQCLDILRLKVEIKVRIGFNFGVKAKLRITAKRFLSPCSELLQKSQCPNAGNWPSPTS